LSAAGIFMILQAVLGIEVLGFDRNLVIDSPSMPNRLDWLKIERLRVGDGDVSLIGRRVPEGTSMGHNRTTRQRERRSAQVGRRLES
jgi:hypothetical protein